MLVMTHKAIAYNVETNEVIAVIQAATPEKLVKLVDAQNYDYDDVAISYGADHGLIYTDEEEYVTTSRYNIYDAELEAAGYSREDARKLAEKLEEQFPTVEVEIVCDMFGGKRFFGENENLGVEIDMAKEKILKAMEPSEA